MALASLCDPGDWLKFGTVAMRADSKSLWRMWDCSFIGQDLSISPAWQVIFFLSVHKEGVAVVVLAKSCFVLACMLFVDTSGGLTHVGYVLSHTPQGME